jgi:NTE family protein
VAHEKFGVALAGGGPLGAIYEIGALTALQEALVGIDLTDCGVYVGVSSGSFLAAGLANGLTPRAMHAMFIDSESAEDPFDPKLLLRPAAGEYGKRLLSVIPLFLSAVRHYVESSRLQGFFASFQRLSRALPTGLFDNAGLGVFLTKLFSTSGRTNDFRHLRHKLFLVATDLDSGEIAPFGALGWDDVPIAYAIQASAALPGLFPPVKIKGRWYVDGVLKKTLHASLALKAGAKLLLCINTLVPFNAGATPRPGGDRPARIVDGGLPLVLSQTFRAIIHSRMEVGMSRYHAEFPDADVVLFEPSRNDADMFFTNVFSYADRQRLCEHAYRKTRAELRRRYDELAPIFARHGVTIDLSVLNDDRRTLLPPAERGDDHDGGEGFDKTAIKLDRTLRQLKTMVDAAEAGS